MSAASPLSVSPRISIRQRPRPAPTPAPAHSSFLETVYTVPRPVSPSSTSSSPDMLFQDSLPQRRPSSSSSSSSSSASSTSSTSSTSSNISPPGFTFSFSGRSCAYPSWPTGSTLSRNHGFMSATSSSSSSAVTGGASAAAHGASAHVSDDDLFECGFVFDEPSRDVDDPQVYLAPRVRTHRMPPPPLSQPTIELKVVAPAQRPSRPRRHSKRRKPAVPMTPIPESPEA